MGVYKNKHFRPLATGQTYRKSNDISKKRNRAVKINSTYNGIFKTKLEPITQTIDLTTEDSISVQSAIDCDHQTTSDIEIISEKFANCPVNVNDIRSEVVLLNEFHASKSCSTHHRTTTIDQRRTFSNNRASRTVSTHPVGQLFIAATWHNGNNQEDNLSRRQFTNLNSRFRIQRRFTNSEIDTNSETDSENSDFSRYSVQDDNDSEDLLDNRVANVADLLFDESFYQNVNQNNGLCEKQLDLLPERLFHKNKRLESPNCSICLLPFEEKQVLVHLTCDHEFHRLCAREWLSRNASCPICRALVTLVL